MIQDFSSFLLPDGTKLVPTDELMNQLRWWQDAKLIHGRIKEAEIFRSFTIADLLGKTSQANLKNNEGDVIELENKGLSTLFGLNLLNVSPEAVRTINLSGNALLFAQLDSKLDPNPFFSFVNLEIIVLDNCRLQYIPLSWLSNKNLKKVSIFNNPNLAASRETWARLGELGNPHGPFRAEQPSLLTPILTQANSLEFSVTDLQHLEKERPFKKQKAKSSKANNATKQPYHFEFSESKK